MQMTCPKCHGEMRTYERSGVTIDQCTECRGIFLDRGELEKLFDAEANWNRQNAGAPPSAPPRPQQAPGGAYSPPPPPPAHGGGYAAPPPPVHGYPPQPAYGHVAPAHGGGYHGHYRQHHGHYRQHGGHHGHYRRRKGFLGELFD
jgi:Zn-finger nucleic acid-binding protein